MRAEETQINVDHFVVQKADLIVARACFPWARTALLSMRADHTIVVC